jgi:hypothetical protein
MNLKTCILVIGILYWNFALGQNKKPEAEFKKTCIALVEHFAKKNIAGINKYINPEIGVYIITRPGAMDVLSHEKKFDPTESFPYSYPYNDTTQLKKYSLKYGTAPKFDCGTEKWNKKGFIADSSIKYKRISDLMRFRSKYEDDKYSKKDFDKICALEKNSRKIVFTDISEKRGLVFHLTFLNGKWYLYLIDTVVSDCGA